MSRRAGDHFGPYAGHHVGGLAGHRPRARRLGVFALAALATAVGLGGCRTAPQRVAHTDFDDPAAVAQVSGEYWPDKKPVELAPGSRVALVDFQVEFVTQKDEGPFESQILIKPPSAVTAALRVVPIGKENAKFSDELRRDVTARLHAMFVGSLEAEGIEVLEPELARAAPAFEDLPVIDPNEAYTLKIYELFPNDTGDILQTEFNTYGDQALVLEPTGGACRRALKALPGQAGADASVVVRLRVGIFRGRASIERSSKVWLATQSRFQELSARRSLVSEPINTARKSGALSSTFGNTYEPDHAAYMERIEQVAQPFVQMLVHSAFEVDTARTDPDSSRLAGSVGESPVGGHGGDPAHDHTEAEPAPRG